MAHENLAEEGKRLEVALRYVSQINVELQDQMAEYERKMAEYEEMIEENNDLRYLMIPNGQSVEKMHEALARDLQRLRKEHRQKQIDLERLHRDKLFSEYNEKMVIKNWWKTDIKEYSKETGKLKRKLEDLKRQTSQETIEQEQQRLNRNIERMKGQIKELVVSF